MPLCRADSVQTNQGNQLVSKQVIRTHTQAPTLPGPPPPPHLGRPKLILQQRRHGQQAPPHGGAHIHRRCREENSTAGQAMSRS